MAQEKRKLTVKLSNQAVRDLNGIWAWTSENFGVDQANEYEAFLKGCASSLSETYLFGKAVEGYPDLLHSLFKSNGDRWSHGHIAVFWVRETKIEVVAFFHTARDWTNQI